MSADTSGFQATTEAAPTVHGNSSVQKVLGSLQCQYLLVIPFAFY